MYHLFISEMSKDYFNRCKYIKASKFGAYAKGAAAGGIFSTMFLLVMIIGQAIQYHVRFNY